MHNCGRFVAPLEAWKKASNGCAAVCLDVQLGMHCDLARRRFGRSCVRALPAAHPLAAG